MKKTPVPTRVLLAGTGGGVGTTTVTALLFAGLSADGTGAPRLFDRSSGELGLRLPEGDDAAVVNDGVVLHDLGAHAGTEAIELLADPTVFLVVVAPATPAGCAAAERVLGEIRSRFEVNGLRRTLVALVGVFGRHRIHALTEQLQDTFGRRGIVVIPQDSALASGGRVPISRLGSETIRSSNELVAVLKDRMAIRGKAATG